MELVIFERLYLLESCVRRDLRLLSHKKRNLYEPLLIDRRPCTAMQNVPVLLLLRGFAAALLTKMQMASFPPKVAGSSTTLQSLFQ